MQKEDEERCMAGLWRLSALREVMEGIFIPLRPERRCAAASLMGYTTVTNGFSYSVQAHPSDFAAVLDIYC